MTSETRSSRRAALLAEQTHHHRTETVHTQKPALLDRFLRTTTRFNMDNLCDSEARLKLVIVLVAFMLVSTSLVALTGTLHSAALVPLLTFSVIGLMWTLGTLRASNGAVSYVSAHAAAAHKGTAYRWAYIALGILTAATLTVFYLLNIMGIYLPTPLAGGALVILWEGLFTFPAIALALTPKK